MNKIKKLAVGVAAGALMLGASIAPAFAADFFNGFEVDSAGWFDNGGTIARVASGTDGITSADGSFHAKINGEGPFTRWGGYESTFPTNGYVTQVDVYLDMALSNGSDDKRFDFSSAINTVTIDPAPTVHRRDFIFHLGTNPSVSNEWLASVSNNAPGWPGNPARSPITIDQSGWYTLKYISG